MDRIGAWLCLLANVIAVPGLGSIIAGRRIGYVQALLALTGFGLTLSWAMWAISEWNRTKHVPIALEWHLGVGTVGALLFLAAWIWAFVSGTKVIREATPKKQ